MIWWLLSVVMVFVTLRTPNGMPRRAMLLVLVLCVAIAVYDTARRAR